MNHPLSGCRLALLACVLLLAAPAAEGQKLLDVFAAQLEIERQLLAEDLRLYAAARSEQQEELEALTAALAEIDAEIEGGEVSVAGFEALEASYAAVEQRLAAAHRTAGEIRQRLYDRLRRTAALEERVVRLGGGAPVQIDPLSGSWSLTLDPGDAEGRIELQLDGTLVTGTYRLDAGGSGSLRGTYSGGELRLERIDSRRGFDAVWRGELDPARRRITGSWTATELATGGPSSGRWSAEKREPRGALGESDDAEGEP